MAIPIPGAPNVIAVPAPGPQGATGGSGYTHNQITPGATWTVSHTLGRKPLGILVTVADAVVIADVSTPDANTVVVVFASPTAGRVDLV